MLGSVKLEEVGGTVAVPQHGFLLDFYVVARPEIGLNGLPVIVVRNQNGATGLLAEFFQYRNWQIRHLK